MLVHQEKNNYVWFERENWKEWFMFLVDDDLRNSPLPKDYVPVRQKGVLPNLWEYWRIQFVPIVKVIYWLNSKWWRLGRYFYKKGWLKIKEEKRPNWFWPIHFIKGN